MLVSLVKCIHWIAKCQMLAMSEISHRLNKFIRGLVNIKFQHKYHNAYNVHMIIPYWCSEVEVNFFPVANENSNEFSVSLNI